MSETQQLIILTCLRILDNIYIVSLQLLALKRAFFYAPRPLIDQAPGKDSLTYKRKWHKYYQERMNPAECSPGIIY